MIKRPQGKAAEDTSTKKASVYHDSDDELHKVEKVP
jgi:hypothetical protein